VILPKKIYAGGEIDEVINPEKCSKGSKENGKQTCKNKKIRRKIMEELLKEHKKYRWYEITNKQ
jgi:hypothetical protein